MTRPPFPSAAPGSKFLSELWIDGDTVRGVHLVDGRRLAAKQVVVCAGAWTNTLEGMPLPADAIFPVRGQMVVLHGAASSCASVVYGHGGYMVPREDGRLLVGSTTEPVGFNKNTTVAGIHRLLVRAIAFSPTLANAPLLEAYAGLRPGTLDDLPLLGPTSLSGLFISSGHFRNGILLAEASAHVMQALLENQEAPCAVDVFSPLRFHAGGLVS